MTLTLTENSVEKEILSSFEAGGVSRRLAERKLFEHFYYLVKHGAKKYSISEDNAASAFSDTILSVIDNIVSHKFEGRSSLKSYTYKIFLNKCVDIIRKETTNRNKVNKTVETTDLLAALPDNTKSIIQKIIDKSLQQNLKQRIEEIGDKCKKLLLFFEDGYSDMEIAALMEYNSPDVVKTSRLRCIEKLRKFAWEQ